MKINRHELKLALDELRMQMVGAQVLFGFQFHTLFQDRFQSPTNVQRLASGAGFATILLTIGLLIAVPSQHRLAERGGTTTSIYRCANRYAELALATLALSLTCNVFLVCDVQWTVTAAVTASLCVLVGCALAWFAIGFYIRRRIHPRRDRGMPRDKSSETPVYSKIDYLLTEARVILPGAQALLGFDLVVTLTKAFDALPLDARVAHFVALACVTVAVMLLISPAAIHRLGFAGDTDERFLRIGSVIVSVALIPLALGIASDVYVATVRLVERSAAAYGAAAATLVVLFTLWYVIPLSMRASK